MQTDRRPTLFIVKLLIKAMIGNISADSSQGLPRKLTAVGTVGHLNQLFTVYEKNWNCPDCGQENYAAR